MRINTRRSTVALCVWQLACLTAIWGCSETSEVQESIVFRILDPTPESESMIASVRVPHQTKADEVLFELRNDSGAAISVFSFADPPGQRIIQPLPMQYHVMNAGGWQPLKIEYCGEPSLYVVDSGESVLLLVYLDPFKWNNISEAAIVRIRAGNFASDPFVLGTARRMWAERIRPDPSDSND